MLNIDNYAINGPPGGWKTIKQEAFDWVDLEEDGGR